MTVIVIDGDRKSTYEDILAFDFIDKDMVNIQAEISGININKIDYNAIARELSWCDRLPKDEEFAEIVTMFSKGEIK